MKNKKLLFILIPVLIIVLALIAGIVFLNLNGSPEKIFKTAINGVFNAFETSTEQYSTIKGTMNLTANVDTENEELKTINTMLEGTSIGLDMEMDTTNMVIKEGLNVVFNNENLIDAEIILQDQKGYVYVKEYLDKYLEIPQENMEYSDLTEYYDKIATIDQNALIEAVREELIESISSREFTREKIQKQKASILDLNQEEFSLLGKEILENLKQNEHFKNALGQCKDDVLAVIDDMIVDYDNLEYDENSRVIISIYTEGLLNKFAGFSIEVKDGQDINLGMLLAVSEQNYEFVMYEQYDEEKEEIIKVRVEDRKESKNKGIATITMTVEEEQFAATYSYEKKGKQTSFDLSTEIEGVGVSFSGDTTESGKNIKGNFVISVQEKTLGKANLNCAYDFTYDVPVQKANIQNAVLIGGLSEDDQTTFMTNFKNSKLYQLIGESGMPTSGLLPVDKQSEVTYNGYTIKYNVPENFELSTYSAEDYKMYMDEEFNSINVGINGTTADTYMKNLDEEYIMTSEFYENQNISDTKSLNINGKEYRVRTITYNDEYGSYVNLYFAYKLDEENCYVVEVESEGGKISMDTIKYFLDVII